MRALAHDRRFPRSGFAVLTILLVAGLWLVGPEPMAGAATTANHPRAGTYQIFTPNITPAPQTGILFRDRTAEFPSGTTGTWSVAKHVITITTTSPAPVVICLNAGQPPNCEFTDISVGPKTPAGIASQSAPGGAAAYLGSLQVAASPFWAVRTGRP